MTEKEWKDRMTNSKYKELQITTHKDNKPYVFVSYKSDSWEIVLTKIVYTLQKKYGLRIYFDKSFNDNNNIWTEQFPKNMSDPNCKAVLSFVDNEYYLSYATLLEVMFSQTFQAVVGMGNIKGLPVVPVNLETIKEPSTEIGKKNTGLGVETFLDGSKNFNARAEKELFDSTFAQLTKRNFWEKSEYIYNRETLSKNVCSTIMGEMFGHIRVSENIYKPDMIEFYDSLVNTIRSVAPDVFDEVAEITLVQADETTNNLSELSGVQNSSVLNWDEFDKIRSFSYNEQYYNVSDAQNAYITIIDILHQNDTMISPNQIVERDLPAYVKFSDGTELSIPKGMYQTVIEGVAKDKVTLYAEPSTEGVPAKAYTILSRDVEKDLVKETSLTLQHAIPVNQVANATDVTNNFTDQLAHFSKYFNKLFDTKNIEWKNGNNIGRMPSIDMDVTINFNCECLEFYSIREHSLKKMFGNIIDYFYQMSGERYFNYIVGVCRAGKTKFPMIIDESFEGDRKWYYNIQGSAFSVYNNYSAKEIFVYLNKHVEMYFDYLKKEGNTVDVSDVIVNYKFGNEEDAALMQSIREQGCHAKSADSSANFINEALVSFDAESFVEFIKLFENVSEQRTREYKEKQMGQAPSIPFSNIILHLPEHVAHVNEIHAEGWQELYMAVIDTLYEATDGEYCKMRTEVELNKNIRLPKMVTKEYYDGFDGKAKSNYKLCTNGQYYYYKTYRSYNVLKEGIKKELDVYMNYFTDSRGIQDDITSVKISYSLPESYADLFR